VRVPGNLCFIGLFIILSILMPPPCGHSYRMDLQSVAKALEEFCAELLGHLLNPGKKA
jgi:hypothetical protein